MIMIKTLLYTGIRISELINVKISDIDFESCQIRINKGKGGKNRIVPFPFSFREILSMYVTQVQAKNPYIFLSLHGKNLSLIEEFVRF